MPRAIASQGDEALYIQTASAIEMTTAMVHRKTGVQGDMLLNTPKLAPRFQTMTILKNELTSMIRGGDIMSSTTQNFVA
jgi:hypothetical protein